MFSVPHLVIIFIVVLVVFGPHKLPELARSLGKMMAEFRKASTDFKLAFEEEMRVIERQAREAEWKKSQEAAAAAAAKAEPQPATLATPAGADTAAVLPEAVTEPEPTIMPVLESVARNPLAGEAGVPETGHSAPAADDPPVSEGSPGAGFRTENEATAAHLAETGNPPAHDDRQPA
jgi:sec-independent protein translocase protein TatB